MNRPDRDGQTSAGQELPDERVYGRLGLDSLMKLSTRQSLRLNSIHLALAEFCWDLP